MSSGTITPVSSRHAEIIKEYERHVLRLGYAPGTIEQRVARLRALGVPPDEATSADVLASLPATAKASTKRVYLGALKAAYRDLRILGITDNDPTVGVRLPSGGRSMPRPLSDEQVTHLLAQVGRERDWTVLGCYAGLRASDVAGLYGEDLLTTRSGFALQLHGKGNVQATVPAHDLVLEVMRRNPARGPLWRMRPDSVSHRWSVWAADLGVDATFHQCRHWFGTNVYRNSGDILVTRDLLRHSSVATTQIYAAVEPEKSYRAVAGL
jgi:integrase/recombinase XerD